MRRFFGNLNVVCKGEAIFATKTGQRPVLVRSIIHMESGVFVE